MSTLVKVRDLHKVYFRGSERIDVLQGVNLDIPSGDFLALMGPSGSGKTTLLNLIGGLDTPTEGTIEVAGDRIIPSVTRVFTNQQTLYILFQAYAPDKSDLARLRAGLTFFRDGRHVNQTPLIEPAQVNETNHTASFRISVPLAAVASGRYTVQAVVIEAGGEQAGFGRGYFALRSAPRD